MSPNRARLLIVDDTGPVRKMLRKLMQELGTIDEAPDGAAALELFRTTPYDLVLTDWSMPRLTGLELLRAIRRGPVRSETPVVICTGDASPARMVEALESGANGFVPKPFAPATLSEKIRSIIAPLPSRPAP